MEEQTNGQADRQTDRQTDDRHTDRQTEKNSNSDKPSLHNRNYISLSQAEELDCVWQSTIHGQVDGWMDVRTDKYMIK